jgi:hypothetical protein
MKFLQQLANRLEELANSCQQCGNHNIESGINHLHSAWVPNHNPKPKPNR